MAMRALHVIRASMVSGSPFCDVTLDSAARHLRRKLIPLDGGSAVLVDLASPVLLADGDCLALEDGRLIRIRAAPEDLTEVRGRDAAHFAQLAWHIGNRHLEAQIEADRILIRRDHVIAHMLEHLGARIRPVRAPFTPEIGAYHAHGHGEHGHGH